MALAGLPIWNEVQQRISAVMLLGTVTLLSTVKGYTTGKYTTEHEPFVRHCLDHVGIPFKLHNAAQEKFIRYNVVPHYIKDIPEFGAEVTFKSGDKADFGNVLSRDQSFEIPTVTWPEADDDEYYSLFMIDLRGWRRCIFIVFKQPVKPLLYKMGITYKDYFDSRQRFNVTQFAEEYNLGEPIAANVFQMATVEQKRNWTVMPDWHKDPMKYITLIPPPEHTLPHDY